MKLILIDSESIEFNNENELSLIIPSGIQGRVINYGQGKGQVEINNTVWGVYVNNDNNYCMSLEQGLIQWKDLNKLVKEIKNTINKQFNINIIVVVEGHYN